MPTSEQEEFVRTQIEGLIESRPWAELAEYRKLEAMMKLDWEGFDTEQQAEVMRNVVEGKDAARWMDGIVADQPGKPPNHGNYQVWREDVRVFDVESVAVHKIEELTQRSGWENDPSVTFHGDDRRPLRLGDVVVDPTCGAWEIQEDGYLAVKPPAPVRERMEREGIVPEHIQLLREWTGSMLEAAGDAEKAGTAKPEHFWTPEDYSEAGYPEDYIPWYTPSEVASLADRGLVDSAGYDRYLGEMAEQRRQHAEFDPRPVGESPDADRFRVEEFEHTAIGPEDRPGEPWWKPELDSMFNAIANPPDFERMMREASKAAPNKSKEGIER